MYHLARRYSPRRGITERPVYGGPVSAEKRRAYSQHQDFALLIFVPSPRDRSLEAVL